MFTQELTISAKDLTEILYNNGYLHEGFKDADLIEITQDTTKAQDLYLYNGVKFTFRKQKI